MGQPPASWLDGIVYPLAKRQDYTNILLTRLIELQGGVPPTRPEWLGELLVTLDNLTSALIRLSNLGLAPVVPSRESFLTGQATVTTAGVAVQLTTSSIRILDGFQLTVIAKPGNTGTIYIGRDKSGAEGAMKFDGLSAGLAVSLKVTNVNSVWVNGNTANDGVSWIVEQ